MFFTHGVGVGMDVRGGEWVTMVAVKFDGDIESTYYIHDRHVCIIKIH